MVMIGRGGGDLVTLDAVEERRDIEIRILELKREIIDNRLTDHIVRIPHEFVHPALQIPRFPLARSEATVGLP